MPALDLGLPDARYEHLVPDVAGEAALCALLGATANREGDEPGAPSCPRLLRAEGEDVCPEEESVRRALLGETDPDDDAAWERVQAHLEACPSCKELAGLVPALRPLERAVLSTYEALALPHLARAALEDAGRPLSEPELAHVLACAACGRVREEAQGRRLGVRLAALAAGEEAARVRDELYGVGAPPDALGRPDAEGRSVEQAFDFSGSPPLPVRGSTAGLSLSASGAEGAADAGGARAGQVTVVPLGTHELRDLGGGVLRVRTLVPGAPDVRGRRVRIVAVEFGTTAAELALSPLGAVVLPDDATARERLLGDLRAIVAEAARGGTTFRLELVEEA